MRAHAWAVGEYALRRKTPLFGLMCVMLAGVLSSVAADPGHDPIGGPTTPQAVQRTVVVDMYEHRFDPIKIAIKAREVVRFLIRNQGDEVHEFMVGTLSMHRRHREELRLMVDEGLIHRTHIGHDIVGGAAHGGRGHASRHHYDLSSLLIEPNQTGELIWMFPDEGEILFACNLPGHFEAGMVGQFTFDG